VAKAEATLRAWRLTDEEIQAIVTFVEKLGSADARKQWAQDRTWAKVDVRAPQDGVILEKNITIGDIVETTMDLFKIADLSQLIVWTHVYEEDLAILQSLPQPVRWTVSLTSQPNLKFPGTMGRVGAVIEPNQHTALVSGRVENPEGWLKAGQFVTVTLEVPPASDELELPSLAVVEDGKESLVFVRTNSEEFRFHRQPVQVVRRFRDVVYVKASESGLQVGDTVVTAGSLLLREAMDQQPLAIVH
jgi:cobalt-zinc-cadmium efflux system membrane fusion protein